MILEWTRKPFWQEQLVLVKCAQEAYQFERDLLKQLHVKSCELYFLTLLNPVATNTVVRSSVFKTYRKPLGTIPAIASKVRSM